MSRSFSLCVMASGGGGNFQSLIDHAPRMGYRIAQLITDRVCGAVDRAVAHGIAHQTLDKKALGAQFFPALAQAVPPDTDLIVLAGFMPILPEWFCAQWPQKIINTHPSLLPAHGGRGMVGVRVQEAVLAAGDAEAGCSVHYVSPVIDGGAVIAQARIPVIPGESAWALGGRVFAEEVQLLPRVVQQLMQERGF
ncbi:MAG: phosphoribosylglycinamide formyltransferase [Azospirillum brasilense]|nr:MAG: phosphoribosylglycinamide formyltransferase [Azospirillum brasilense]